MLKSVELIRKEINSLKILRLHKINNLDLKLAIASLEWVLTRIEDSPSKIINESRNQIDTRISTSLNSKRKL